LSELKRFMVLPFKQPGYITIEVSYALPHQQFLKRIEVCAGTALAQAIELSGVAGLYPEIDFKNQKVGIYGKIVNMDTILQQNDRVEIYRSLLIDPKEKRRIRSDSRKGKRRILT
jgi:uncharacterized protein